MNGIQEVSGSIPLISTRRNTTTKVVVFLRFQQFLRREGKTSRLGGFLWIQIPEENAQIIAAAIEDTVHADLAALHPLEDHVIAADKAAVLAADIGDRGKRCADVCVLPQQPDRFGDPCDCGKRSTGIFQVRCDIGLDRGKIRLCFRR